MQSRIRPIQILWRSVILFIGLSFLIGFASQPAGVNPRLLSDYYPLFAIGMAVAALLLAMAWLWLELKCRHILWRLLHRPKPENPCPACGTDMDRTEKSSFSGDDMRTYTCAKCGHEEIVNYGMATWKAMSGTFDDP